MSDRKERPVIDLPSRPQRARRSERAFLALDPKQLGTLNELARKWPGRHLVKPGPLGGRPPLQSSFLDAVLDFYDKNHGRRTTFAARVIPVAIRHQQFNTKGLAVPYPYLPNVRSWMQEAFPSSGDLRLQAYTRRAVQEGLLIAYTIEGRLAERFDQVPSVALVPELAYISSLPTI